MHASIGTTEISQVAQVFDVLPWQRVEQAHLDIGVGTHQGKGFVYPRGKNVIHQQAHPHAAVSSSEQAAGKQGTGAILFNDEVLGIYRSLGKFKHAQARAQCVHTG